MLITLTPQELELIHDALLYRYTDIERERHKQHFSFALRSHHAKWAQELEQLIKKL